MMEQFQIRFSDNIKLLSPLGFKESLFLWKDAKVVMTDSGGLHFFHLRHFVTPPPGDCVAMAESTLKAVLPAQAGIQNLLIILDSVSRYACTE